jgi:hypothetical protein
MTFFAANNEVPSGSYCGVVARAKLLDERRAFACTQNARLIRDEIRDSKKARRGM